MPTMARKLVLSCLIEGQNQKFRIFIPDGNTNVDTLRETIFEGECQTWNECGDTLSLLKVNIPVVPFRL